MSERSPGSLFPPSAPDDETQAIEFVRPWIYDKQRLAIFEPRDFAGHPARYSLIEASTKVGKTIGCLAWLAERGFAGREGQNFWWVAPVYRQAKIAYRRAKRGLDRRLYAASESEMSLRLANGAVVAFLSADRPDGLYGEDVFAAVIDEANHVMRPQYVPFYKTAAKSSAYSVVAADHGTLFTVTGTTTITLPTATSVWAGFTVTIVNLDTTGGATPLIATVTAAGGAGIYFPSANASVTSLPLANTGNQATFVSNGTNWIALGVTLEIAFSTALTSAQSVANNTLTKVQLNSKNKDVGGYFDATTNFRYTPLVPGLYAFAGFLSFTTEVNATGYMVAIYKNATTYMGRADGVASGTAVQGEGVTAIVAMNGTTDFIELYTQQTSGGALTASSTNQTTQLSGYRLA